MGYKSSDILIDINQCNLLSRYYKSTKQVKNKINEIGIFNNY